VDFERIGRAQDILLAQRTVHSIAPEGKRLRETDAEAAEILQSLLDGESEALVGLLRGGGWDLREYNDSMAGVPRRGRVWIALRRPDATARSLLTLEPAWRLVAVRTDEPRSTTVYWFTFIWMLMLSFMYERINRPVSAESEYVSALFERGELEEKVNERIEALRLAGVGEPAGRLPIAEALLEGTAGETTRKQIQKRVGKFLEAMEGAQMIDRYRAEDGAEGYRQTLLCAVQLNELYSHGLIQLTSEEDTIAEMDRFLAAERTGADEGETSDGAN
jgi:hypothetical protein